MPILPPVNVDPTNIENMSDIRYRANGALDFVGDEIIYGWELVAQELWTLMISDEGSLGTDGELAIDIRQFMDYPPNAETAEIIEDHIIEKIQAHPLLSDLGLIIETVPVDTDAMEIVFKRPADPTGVTDDVVDLDFTVAIDAVRGVITGLLDETEPRILYTTTPMTVTEYRHVLDATTKLSLGYEPVEADGISVYNIDDIDIVNGEIITNDLSSTATIEFVIGLTYPLYDYFDDVYLDGRTVKEHHLYDSEGVEVSQSNYSIINNTLIPSYSVIESGTYTLSIVTENRYANNTSIERKARSGIRLIYPYMRPYEYEVQLDRMLVPNTYVIKYNIYSE